MIVSHLEQQHRAALPSERIHSTSSPSTPPRGQFGSSRPSLATAPPQTSRFESRRPAFRLELPKEDPESFNSTLEKRWHKQRLISDAAYLPKSTNMGLPAHMNVGEKYNFEEVTGDRSSQSAAKKINPPTKMATFKRSIPCFFVPHVPSVLAWYREVLGFTVVGKPDDDRAELYRGVRGATAGAARDETTAGGVSLYLRTPDDDDQVRPRGTLWIEVDAIDDLHQEVAHKVAKYAQDLTDYFPKHHFGSAKVLQKPRNTGFGQREMCVVDSVGNHIFFFQQLA